MQRAHDCDMVIIHDNDLERIDGIGKGTVSGNLNSSSLFLLCHQLPVPESLQSEVMVDLIRMSNIEIYTACCGELQCNCAVVVFFSPDYHVHIRRIVTFQE